MFWRHLESTSSQVSTSEQDWKVLNCSGEEKGICGEIEDFARGLETSRVCSDDEMEVAAHHCKHVTKFRVGSVATRTEGAKQCVRNCADTVQL